MVILYLISTLIVHPIHTTMTELVVDRTHNLVRATVRGFADDLGSAAGARGLDQYVADRLRFSDRDGKPVVTRACGTRRESGVVWVCIEAVVQGDAGAIRVSNSLLSDRFSDQVNIVQVQVDQSRKSLLFTRGDREKPLR